MLPLANKVVHFCFYASFSLCCSEAMVNISKNDSVTAIFAMGDSFMDTGNNNHRNSIIKADFLPHGKDFLGGKSTGRFTNNRTLSDHIAGKLGVKEYLPAYLDPSIQDKDLISGVSFASGGSGYDNLTSEIVNVIPLSTQLELFKEYTRKLNNIVGEEAANNIIAKGVYLVSSSSNDWAISYTAIPIRRLQYNVTAYATLLANNARNFFEGLHKLGARKIVVFGTPYIGFFPLAKTVCLGIRKCIDMFNEEAETFNKMLKNRLDSLRSSLPQSTICYVDYYKISQDMILNPRQYGFEVVERACCGTGLFEAVFLCNKLSPICPDDSKFLFWDSVHLTDNAYRIVVNHALPELMECLL